MRRASLLVMVFTIFAVVWTGGPLLYRASWLVSGAPRATAVLPASAADPSSTVASFDIDATRAPPDDGSPPPWKTLATDPLPLPPGCVLPQAPADAAIAIVGVNEGRALSPVALGNADETTEIVDLVVETGEPPLYLLLSASKNMIWRIRGDTARVAHAVLLASTTVPHEPADAFTRQGRLVRFLPPPPMHPQYAGIVGLDPSRVSTISRKDCFSVGSNPEGRQAVRATAVVISKLGRAPMVLAAIYEPSAIRIPSGRAAMTRHPIVPAPIANSSDNSWPDGVADILAHEVVAAVPAHTYSILPEQAGWDQLIKSAAVTEREDATWILRPIERFPPGLGWGPPIVLGALVPMPAGPSGLRCVRRQVWLYWSFSVKVRGNCL